LANTNKTINGTGADDNLQGTAGADVIKGNAGDDLLFGLGGNDRLIGGSGNDEIDGGRGNDILSGDNGTDLFVFSFGDLLTSLPPEGATEAHISLDFGHDVVTDFQMGSDQLQVRAGSNPVVLTLAQLAEKLLLTQADVDGDGTQDTVITIDYIDAQTGIHWTDETSSITLLGVTATTVDQVFAG
jgi:Ca2+-binding RTX toxin-like protein